MSARVQPPVEERIDRPDTASQTWLAHADNCLRSAFLYAKYGGGPQTAAMARGEAFHDFVERAINLLIEQGEDSMAGEIAKDLMQMVLDERTDLTVPAREQDACRVMAWHWGEATVLDVEHLAAVESTFELELAGWRLRGRIDLATVYGSDTHVIDWKTSLAPITSEQMETDFQALTYALLVGEGRPEDGAPIGGGISNFHLHQVYPRYRTAEGPLVTRSAYADRARLFDHKRTLESLLGKLDHGFETGEWPATPGAHCSRCPCAAECPIPEQLREVRTIGTMGEASEVAERILFLDSEGSGLKKSLRAYAEEHGAVPAGSDLEFNFTLTESDRLADKEGLFEFLKANGAEPDRFFKHATSTRFGKKKVAA